MDFEAPPLETATLSQRAFSSATWLLDRIGYLKLCFQEEGALRILRYHGVCSDEVADESWVPPYFVTAGNFAKQLRIMTRFGRIVHLPEVIDKLTEGKWKGGACFAITFDGVATCTFQHALPVLTDFGQRATFFLATGHISSGRLFNADVLQLLQTLPQFADQEEETLLDRLMHCLHDEQHPSLEQLRSAFDEAEREVWQNVDLAVLETLRPMNWSEVRELWKAGHDMGGNTVDHVVLAGQPDEVRRAQIGDSLATIEEHVGQKPVGFAYPNGGPADFGGMDYESLREFGVKYAVSSRCGSCGDHSDCYALPRVSIGKTLTSEKFSLEISSLLDRRRQAEQGWL